MQRIFLIGLMASGKTTVGRRLAERLGCEYVDNDATVAELAGVSTVELSRRGGTELHDWEHRYAEHVAALPAPLVAGIPASIADRPDDLALLAGAGLLVYLDAPVEVLADRVRNDPPRPWITGDPVDLLRGMHATRDAPLRGAAGLVVDATADPADLVRRILATDNGWDPAPNSVPDPTR